MFGTSVYPSYNRGDNLLKRNIRPLPQPEFEHNWHLLGNGSYGKVYLNPLSMDAVKVVQKSNSRGVKNIEREKKVLKSINHPYILKYKSLFETEDSIYMCLEYALGGDLYHVLRDLGSLPERVVKVYSAEIASAISHLHSCGFAHRDIKPENILIDIDGHVKLADFGLCEGGVDGLRGLITLCGTPPYIAPEVYNCSAFTGGYGSAVDWWALGVLLYEMVVGNLPWGGLSYHEVYGPKTVLFPKYLSKPIISFIESLLIANPSSRLGTWNSREVLNHNFFSGVDWQAIGKRSTCSPFNPHTARAAANTPKMEESHSNIETQPLSPKLKGRQNIFAERTLTTSPISSMESQNSFRY